MPDRNTFAPDLFKGRHVLVTGASSGIGAAIATAFAEYGAYVTGTASTQARADSIEMPGVSLKACDVRKDAEVDALLESLPQLDILVTAAGIARRVEEYDWDVFKDVTDVNLYGTARFALRAREALKATKGSIVTIASMLSTFGDRLVPAYAASKGGVSQLTKSLAIEYASDGIRVNAIAPGWIHTDMTDSLVQDSVHGPTIAGRTAMKRWGVAEEIASGALFLSSPAASYITGSTLTIDGGYAIT